MSNPVDTIQQLESGDEVLITGRLKTGDRRTRYRNIETSGKVERIDGSENQTTCSLYLDRDLVYDDVVITTSDDNTDSLVLVVDGDSTGVINDLTRL